MKKYCLIILAFAMAGTYQAQAQVITDFGTAGLNPVDPATDYIAPWTAALASQSTSSITLNGEPASGGGELFSTLGTTVPLYDQNLSTLKLALQGEITTAMPNNGFSVVLYDTSGGFNSLTFNYTWGQFTSVGVTQTILASSPAESGLFNGTVGYYAIEVGGGPTDTINAQFDSLTAVPEPSTYAMFGFGLAMLFFVYRRKVGQA